MQAIFPCIWIIKNIKSNVLRCLCSLKFENSLFSNRLFRCIFVQTASWLLSCCYCHKLSLRSLTKDFFYHSGNCRFLKYIIPHIRLNTLCKHDDSDVDELFLYGERRLASFPAGTIVRNSHHLTPFSHTAGRIWLCAEPNFRLCWIKLCSSDNHYTTAPKT